MAIDAEGILVLSASKSDNVSGSSANILRGHFY